MDLSQPLITPEELSCLLGWPMPVDLQDSRPVTVPSAPASAAPVATDTSLALAS